MPLLRSIYLSCLTRNVSYAGTDNSLVLIVNQDGEDKLHRTWPTHSASPYWQFPARRGEAFLLGQESGVQQLGINSRELTNSSIRMAIRGSDAWKPEHLLVWGRDAKSNALIPLAARFNTNVQVSTDAAEGPISIPIPLTSWGKDETGINRLLLVTLTEPDYSSGQDRGTDSNVVIQVHANGALKVNHILGDTPQSDLEAGYTNWYLFSVSPFRRSDVDSIRLSIKGHDAWRPAVLYLFGLDTKSSTPQAVVPLVSYRVWPFGWLSTDSNEGQESVELQVVQ